MLQISFRDSMAISFNDPTLMGEFEQSRFGIDGTCDILVNQRRIDQEALTEEADRTLPIGKTYEGDTPISPGQTLLMEPELLGQQLARHTGVNVPGRTLGKFRIAVLGVVEGLKGRKFTSQVGQV